MEMWIILFTLVFLLAALGFVGWKLAQYFRRGWKDHVWIWRETNRGAIFVAFVIGIQMVGFAIRDGIDDKVVFYAVMTVIGVAMPYLAYIAGRLLGMWHRSRQGHTLS
jgi:hypothetical protein